MSDIAAIVLAAGRASRFGGPQSKVLAEFEGEALVRRAVRQALAAGLKVTMVTGYQAAEVEGTLAGLPVALVHNPAFADGMSGSLKLGLTAAQGEAALVLLADMPKVDAALIKTLCATFAANPQASAIVPTYHGERGNPVILARCLFEQVAQLSGDQGARKLLAAAQNVVEVAIEDEAVALDIDTPEALAKLRRNY